MEKTEILNKYFASVFTVNPGSRSPLPPLRESSTPDITPISIDPHGVKRLLDGLDIHKSVGPDNIPTRLLKEFSTELAPILTVIFQASLHQCCVPREWKIARIVPIHKKDDHSIPGNYRPISLTSICSKLLEHIIYSHIFHTWIYIIRYAINNMASASVDLVRHNFSQPYMTLLKTLTEAFKLT